MRPVSRDICLGLIHQFEGKNGAFRPEPALDPTGHYEIGWGHKLQGPRYAGVPISATMADILAIADLNEAAAGVCDVLGDAVDPLTDAQYAALTDFVFNLGAGNFASSTLCRLVKAGDLTAAADEFGKWVYGHVDGVAVKFDGLVRRRAAEEALWRSGL